MPFDCTDPSQTNRSKEATHNHTLLLTAMTHAGFTPHKLECWHYSYPPAETNPVIRLRQPFHSR